MHCCISLQTQTSLQKLISLPAPGCSWLMRCSSTARTLHRRGCFCPSWASPVDEASCRPHCPPLSRQRVITTRAGFARSRAVAAVNSHTGRPERTCKHLLRQSSPSKHMQLHRHYFQSLAILEQIWIVILKLFKDICFLF